MRNFRGFLWICVFLFLAHGVSYGQSKQGNIIDVTYTECVEKDTSVGNICTCAFDAYAKWDKLMDREYKKLLKSLRLDKDKTALKQAQNAWIAYRDNEFKSYDNIFNHPGNKWCLLRANGRIDIVRARALQLQAYNNAFDKHKL